MKKMSSEYDQNHFDVTHSYTCSVIRRVQVMTDDDEETTMPPKSPPRWRRRSLSPMMRVQNMMKDEDSVKDDDKK